MLASMLVGTGRFPGTIVKIDRRVYIRGNRVILKQQLLSFGPGLQGDSLGASCFRVN